MNQLLTDIQTRLKKKVTALKYIGEDRGELDKKDTGLFDTACPCVFIEAEEIAWHDEAEKRQRGIAEIKLRLVNRTNSATKNPDFFMTSILQEIHKSLHGWNASTHYGLLTRTKTKHIRRDDDLSEYETVYSVQITDTSAMEKLTTSKRPRTIEISLK